MKASISNNILVESSKLADNVKIFRKELSEAEKKPKKIRVAFYCRVSTDLEIQKTSLESQESFDAQYFAEHPDCEYAGTYSDPGITGTNVKKRKAFLQMIEDAKAGKIDRIITKSLSRFARNTVDVLTYTRLLKSLGVTVYFQEENLDTSSSISELLLTIYAAVCQEESFDISESVKTNFRLRAQQGIAQFNNLYGYTSTKNKKWIIIPEEAKIVRFIFNMLIMGYSLASISEMLNKGEILSPGKALNGWDASSVCRILRNEKYMGAFLIQKVYTEDVLTHKTKSNRNLDIPQYYIEHNHEGIVTKEVYEEAQYILNLRSKSKGFCQYPYYGFLICPKCKEKLVACALPIQSSPRAWFCPGHGDGKIRKERSDCPAFAVLESVLDEAVIKGILELKAKEFDDATREHLSIIRGMIQRNNRVERYFLKILVNNLTLSSDWKHVIITWKNGKRSEIPLKITEAKQHPNPKVDKKAKSYTVYGGVKMYPHKAESAKQGIDRREEYIQNLLITTGGDDFIPIVNKKRKGKKNGCYNKNRKQS